MKGSSFGEYSMLHSRARQLKRETVVFQCGRIFDLYENRHRFLATDHNFDGQYLSADCTRSGKSTVREKGYVASREHSRRYATSCLLDLSSCKYSRDAVLRWLISITSAKYNRLSVKLCRAVGGQQFCKQLRLRVRLFGRHSDVLAHLRRNYIDKTRLSHVSTCTRMYIHTYVSTRRMHSPREKIADSPLLNEYCLLNESSIQQQYLHNILQYIT